MVYSATPEILSGGNPELTEETSDSLTVGFVYQPEYLSGSASRLTTSTSTSTT
jgi:outer membrane receptor protein involved in Fe transport